MVTGDIHLLKNMKLKNTSELKEAFTSRHGGGL